MKSTASLGKFRPFLVPVLLLAFFLFSLALRGIPALYAPPGGFLSIYDSDTWYTLRQAEVMVHHFPQYNWFDPMTAYPVGKAIDWGPLYPALAALLSLAAGASTQADIITTSMWLGPLLGACMVPVMYLLGKAVWNGKAGLVAAGLVSFAAFRLFFLSSYGFVDHHIAEVLTTSLFFFAYCTTLAFARAHPPDLSRAASFIPIAALALLAGALLSAGLLASTTVVLLLPAILIYTVIQVIIDTLDGRPAWYLAVIHTGIFATASLALLGTGIRAEGLSLMQYSAGLLYAFTGVMALTWILAAISWASKGRKILFLAVMAGLGVAMGILVLLIPPLGMMVSQVLGALSGPEAYSLGIQELLPWSFLSAWRNLNVLPLLMAGGFVFLALRLKRERWHEGVFLGVWAGFLLVMTALYSRFLYYLAVPLLLLAAICIVEILVPGLPALAAWAREGTSPRGAPAVQPGDALPSRRRKGDKKRMERAPGGAGKTGDPWYRKRAPALLAAAVLILLAIVLVISLVQAIQFGTRTPSREIHGDWLESLDWMGGHTPSPMVDYFGSYNRKNFSYPGGSYGVMAPWEAGHWVTFFSKRIPNMNPFQDNLMGEKGGAAFFLSSREEEAAGILAGLGTRYVITDAWTATDQFTSLIPWVDPSVNTTPYISYFFVPDTLDRSRLLLDSYYTDGYYRAMVTRLHFFDGSGAVPTLVTYVEYTNRKVPGEGETAPMNTVGPVITRIEDRNATDAFRDAALVNSNPRGTTRAAVVSSLQTLPTTAVPALSHFRLVHESPSRVAWEEDSGEAPPGDIRYVKVFEFVKGAHIRGNGIIELPLVTNTGRAFTYRAESVNGEFIVPYSTQGNPYEVQATGPYRIAGSAARYEVKEEDVLSGNTVS